MIRLNPIVKKDIRVSSRSMHLSLGLFFYELLLVLVLSMILQFINQEQDLRSTDNVYQGLLYIFPVLSIIQTGIVGFITPVITSSMISGERERQTFDIMMTTCMSPVSIVIGKVATNVVRILLYVVASLPIMAISFIVGGMPITTLLLYFVCITILSIFTGSIGIFSSAVCKKSKSAQVVTFLFYSLFCFGSFFPVLMSIITDTSSSFQSGCILFFLLMNPLIFFEEFYSLSMANVSLFGAHAGYTPIVGRTTNPILSLFTQGCTWAVLSGIVLLLISFLFILAAAKRINPLYAKNNKEKRKKK